MPERVINGGAETGGTAPWFNLTRFSVVSAPVFAGSHAFEISSFTSFGGAATTGTANQSIVLPAEPLALSLAYRVPGPLAPSNGLLVRLFSAGGAVMFSEIIPPPAPDTWGTWLNFYTPPVADTYRLELNAQTRASTGVDRWYLDEISAREAAVPKGFVGAYAALCNRLKSINGATGGYHFDTEGRITTYDREPKRGSGISLPYVSVIVRSDETYEDDDGFTWGTLACDLKLWGPDSHGDTAEESNAVNVLKAHDDLVKCVSPTTAERPHWDLDDNTIRSVQLLSHRVRSDLIQRANQPLATVTVGLRVALEPAQLGP